MSFTLKGCIFRVLAADDLVRSYALVKRCVSATMGNRTWTKGIWPTTGSARLAA